MLDAFEPYRFMIFFTLLLVSVFLVTGLLIRNGLREDDRREATCAKLGGYVDFDTSLCRDRITEDVLATWNELKR